MVRRKKMGKIDRPFLITLLVLIGIGLLMVFSASMYSSTVNEGSGFSQFIKQSLFAVVGLILMWLISRINYQYLRNRNTANLLLGIAVFLLLLVFIPGIGVEVNGAKRWIKLGFTFQPSEIAKICGVIYLSSIVTNYPECLKGTIGNNPNTVTLWVRCFLPILLLCGLTVIEPSMSAALAIGLGMVAVLYFAGLPLRLAWPFLAFLILGAGFFLTVSWRWTRLLSFFGANNTNYQIYQSLLAFGSGGIFGVGLGNGKQKLLFLPEIQNDFIFANIGEEFGLIGCIVVLALYFYLIFRGFQIAVACKNKFGFLYTSSVMTLLGYQVLINVGVATRIYPVTGMALPFISYGGTSIVILLATIGPVLNISRQVKLRPFGKMKVETQDEYTNGSRRDRRSYLSGDSHL